MQWPNKNHYAYQSVKKRAPPEKHPEYENLFEMKMKVKFVVVGVNIKQLQTLDWDNQFLKLSIYSASVNPPDSPYTYLLTGNTLFDTVYSTFNTTGVLAIGGVLLAAGGKKIVLVTNTL